MSNCGRFRKAAEFLAVRSTVTLTATPVFHRWHHSRDRGAWDKNFAGLLPLWDILFGTYYMPKDRWPENFGIRDRWPKAISARCGSPSRAWAEAARRWTRLERVLKGSGEMRMRGGSIHPKRFKISVPVFAGGAKSAPQ